MFIAGLLLAWEYVGARFRQVGACNFILGVVDETQRMDDDVDWLRGIQPEGFVADDAYLWTVLGKEVGYNGYITVGTHEDSHLLLGDALSHELFNGAVQAFECLLLLVLVCQQLNAHEARFWVVVGYLLGYLVVSTLKLVGLGLFLQLFVFQPCGFGEEGVVELNDVSV